MATRAVQQVFVVYAWDTSANAYKTGDSANISTSWIKDGTRSATSNANSEVDATNCPGAYKVTITSTETDCLEGVLCGKSTTANIVIIPTHVAFDQIPNAVPGATGGLVIAGSNAATTFSGLTTGALSCTTITASGAVAFQSTFAVTTSTALAALSATTVTFSGAVALQSTLGVTGTTTLAAVNTGAIAVTGAVSTSGTVTLNALTVTNATTLSGAVSLGSTLGVTGTATFAAVTTTGTVTMNALTVSNATTLTGAVSLGSTLGVTGTTTLAALTTTGTVTMNALTVSNATTLTGAVTATSASNDIRGVLLQKTISAAMDELTGDPGATPTAAQAIMLDYMALRNKRDTTASTDTICKNDGTVILTAALSDDTVTFEKAKYA